MDHEKLRALFRDVADGRVPVEQALERLRDLPYVDVDFAKVDTHRALRSGAPEAVFCQGKTAEQIVGIVTRLAAHHANVLATRAEEAAVTAEALGNRVERAYDCGVAGLHRLLDQRHLLTEAHVIIVVAGMEGALPSVVGGLVDRPVIAVPTSVGYGTSFGGLTPLLAMLNSCAPGVSVVNIDNGYGAACQASLINHLIAKIR